VYRFTGWQGLFKIPESWCRECDLFVRAADQAAEQADVPATVNVLAWFPRILGTLRWGIRNPPLMVVDGDLVASGYDVPEPERIVDAVRARSPGVPDEADLSHS